MKRGADLARAARHIVSTLLLCICWSGQAMGGQTVNLVGDPWPPYVEGRLGEYANGGIAVDIIERVFAEIDGVEVRFPLIPWKRALLEVERGLSDGIPMLLRTPERERFMTYTVPLVTGQNLIWSVADAGAGFEWTSVGDLYGRRIGIVEGYSYGEEMDGSFASGEISAVRAPTVEQLFEMLVAGRLELVMANDAVGYALSRGYGDVGIRPAARPINSETFYIGMSKKSPSVELIPEINRAIEKLRRDGVIDRIVRGEAGG